MTEKLTRNFKNSSFGVGTFNEELTVNFLK